MKGQATRRRPLDAGRWRQLLYVQSDDGIVSRERERRGETFFHVVRREFAWLTVEAGMVGPELTDIALPCATYHGHGIAYQICYDDRDACVQTSVRLTGDAQTRWTPLEQVVRAASYPPQEERIRTSAQTRYARRQSLAAQSEWLRRLHPQLSGPHGKSLLDPMAADDS